jgi:hypothetical protein
MEWKNLNHAFPLSYREFSRPYEKTGCVKNARQQFHHSARIPVSKAGGLASLVPFISLEESAIDITTCKSYYEVKFCSMKMRRTYE